jgi:diguanylate cyclase (GGDEF)-like protein/PAS domain S-box-containing protein
MNDDVLSHPELLDQLFEGAYIVDSDRKILFWNTAAERITGYSREDVAGKSCWDGLMKHIDKNGHCLCESGGCPTARAMQEKSSVEVELFIQHKSGHRVPVSVRTVPILNSDGQITGAIEMMSDISHLQAQELRITQLEKLALVDSLTQLANRRYLESLLESTLARVKRFDQTFGILFIDIDDFKHINDTYGHERGDEVLRVISRTLKHSTRTFDTAGRWGGEEFLVLCEQVTHEQLHQIAERYRVLVEGSPLDAEPQPLRFTISVGGCMMRVDDSVREVVRRADMQMYRSKDAGKNRVSIDCTPAE